VCEVRLPLPTLTGDPLGRARQTRRYSFRRFEISGPRERSRSRLDGRMSECSYGGEQPVEARLAIPDRPDDSLGQQFTAPLRQIWHPKIRMANDLNSA